MIFRKAKQLTAHTSVETANIYYTLMMKENYNIMKQPISKTIPKIREFFLRIKHSSLPVE